MGTRVLIVCTDGETVSPGVYKHFDGYRAPEIIAAANAITAGAQVSPEQAASFVVAAAVNGDVEHYRLAAAAWRLPSDRTAPSIRIEETEERLRSAILSWVGADAGRATMAAAWDVQMIATDHGLEAGIIVVDVRQVEWTWWAFTGELAEGDRDGLRAGARA